MRILASCLVSTSLLSLAACSGEDPGGDASAGSSDTDESTTADTSAGETTTGGETSSASGESASASTSTTEPGTTGPGTTDPGTTDPGTTDPGTTDPGTTGTTDPGTTGTTDPGTTTDDSTTGGVDGTECIFDDFVNQGALVLDYAQFDPVIGSHCLGTNHQEITDIERVVFLGDSVTVGTPPSQTNDYYRSQLANVLVDRFGLTPPSNLWKAVNLIDGVALQQESGDFASCSKWGARTDDFEAQIADCLTPDNFDKRTLVVITMGGNDLAAVAKDGANGKPLDQVYADTEQFVQLMRDAVHWMIDDPNKFPNGIFVTFANVYEFTDGTGDVTSCPAAGLGGFDKPWENPDDLKDLVIWANEQYLDIAVETGTDMVFMLENFCGHGFKAGDPMAPCYRGPGQQNYFDLTCIHPTPKGHDVITDLFTAVIDE